MIQYIATFFILYMWISTCIGVYNYVDYEHTDIWDLLAPIGFGFFLYSILVLLPVASIGTK